MPDSTDLLPLLKRHWGFDRFRPLQADAVQAVLEGRDSVVVLPTGGGKSLCYQAPALLLPGLAVVVSPLISLMKDQVDALTSNGIVAAAVNSTSSPQERLSVADAVRTGRMRLLYISPERLCMEKTLDFLESANVAFFAIDEAHCISQWGHDFRPEYRMLSLLKERFPHAAVHAYTATATEQVRKDIASQLNLSDPAFHVGSFDRPNLAYRVEQRRDVMTQIREVIARHKGESGIIYCISRKQTKEVSDELNSLGIKSSCYHAGLPDVVRHTTQEAFQREAIDIVVATVAFGMGIDKSNVRFVIHAGAPKSIENYQQESGRAGRDGLEAECCLFYGAGDFIWWRKVAEEMPPEARGVARATLKKMEDFCQGVTCRHRSLVEYFGQELDKENCGACDVCLSELDVTPDAKVVAQKVLSCIVRLKESFGAQYTAQVLCGSEEQRILANGHQSLSTYGLLKESGSHAVRMWIDQLIAQGCCEKHGDGDYQKLRVTPSGWEVLRGESTPRLLHAPRKSQKKAKRAEATGDLWDGVDSGLFEELRTLRRTKADELGIAAFIVFSDESLRDMSRKRPTTLARFRQVNGVGEKKQSDYGELFTSAIKQYCEANQLDSDVDVTAPPPAPVVPLTQSPARRRAFEMFDAGISVSDVALKIDRAASTTSQYLLEYIRHTGRVDPAPWVDEATARQIDDAAAKTQSTPGLKPIFELLGSQVTYEQLRVHFACRQNRPGKPPAAAGSE